MPLCLALLWVAFALFECVLYNALIVVCVWYVANVPQNLNKEL